MTADEDDFRCVEPGEGCRRCAFCCNLPVEWLPEMCCAEPA